MCNVGSEIVLLDFVRGEGITAAFTLKTQVVFHDCGQVKEVEMELNKKLS